MYKRQEVGMVFQPVAVIDAASVYRFIYPTIEDICIGNNIGLLLWLSYFVLEGLGTVAVSTAVCHMSR